MEWDEEKHTGSTVLVQCPIQITLMKQLLRRWGMPRKLQVAMAGEALTLITEYETMSSEERLWFASPNLRMRVSVLKRF